jgi:hypothetical protein
MQTQRLRNYDTLCSTTPIGVTQILPENEVSYLSYCELGAEKTVSSTALSVKRVGFVPMWSSSVRIESQPQGVFQLP